MKTVLLLTNSFPYFPGEQFIEDEIGFWAKAELVKVVVVPLHAHGIPRELPAGVSVDLTLANWLSKNGRFRLIPSALLSRYFWAEFWLVYRTRRWVLRCYAEALRTSAELLNIEQGLRRTASNHEGRKTAYCYWNDMQAYAAALLKRRGLINKVFSRAHGFDLYEERRVAAYMPLKRQFLGDMDAIFPVSAHGKKYMERKYAISPNRVLISRLGIPVPRFHAAGSNEGRFNIVSISFCVGVKRIDRIIDALVGVASTLSDINITWVHIGDGPLLSSLKERAARQLRATGICYEFLGDKSNSFVKAYLCDNPIDLLINSSDSEGIPVSIMEAMACGVPAIAPNVGGISELVSNNCGLLLPPFPSPDEIANGVVEMYKARKDAKIRESAREKIVSDYSAEKNYGGIINAITMQRLFDE